METLVHMSGKQKAIVMMAVMMTMFLAALDQTIVSTALPIIVKEFNALEHLSWVFTAYMLSSTVTVPIYGKLSDLYGRKGFYLASILIFLTGSALCGLSQNMTQLIIFRAIQGIGGGAMMTSSFAIIADLFTPAERGKWQGLMGGVFGLSSVFGPLIGGWLADNLSWRWDFYVNMPLGVLALLGIIFLLPKIKSSVKDKSIDFFGALYLAMGLISLLLALVWGGTQYAWNSEEILLLFGLSFLSLSFFASVESLVKNPILPLNLFKNRVFSVSILLSFLTAMGVFGVISYIPLFAQKVIGITATDSGTILIPMMAGMIFASVVSGQIISRTKKYKFLAILGTLVVTLSMVWLSTMTAATTQGELMLRMVCTGLGMGLTVPIFNIAVQNAFDHSQIGVVTASTQLFRSIGGTVGIAIFGGILNSYMSAHPEDLAGAIAQVFHIGIFFMATAFVVSFFLKEIPLQTHEKQRGALQEAGVELAVEEGSFSAKNEPVL